MKFDRVNVHALAFARTVAHHGVGEIGFHRVAERDAMGGTCNFIDVAVVPPGASIGRHRHADHEEEFYLVLKGTGRMWRDGEEFSVRAGDLIRNRAGGAHGLVNDGAEDLMIFVFELTVPATEPAP
jgi:mannose-6-phosphate isomerase-like protein (cupin superfamily)